MNTLFKSLTILALLMLVATACSAQAVEAKLAEKPAMASSYGDLLGKSVSDKPVADFMASNSCSTTAGYQLCGSTGIALAIDPNHKVKSVILFPGRANGFAAFHGELPYGLHWDDSKTVVEQKLGVTPNKVFLQEADLPNESGTPDNIRLWVAYQEPGITIVYNTLSADSNVATIHAILLTK